MDNTQRSAIAFWNSPEGSNAVGMLGIRFFELWISDGSLDPFLSDVALEQHFASVMSVRDAHGPGVFTIGSR